MVAVLSDIHNNLHALNAVLADIPKVSAIWVLGDTVGGACPYPCQVLDRLMGLDVPVKAILGNWERWAMDARHNIDPAWRADGTKLAAGVWSFEQLKPRHWDFLSQLGTTMEMENTLLFHGTPTKIAQQIWNYDDAKAVAEKHDKKWLLGGHTHHAQYYKLGNQRVVGVGSVGLAADGIAGTACYVLLDDDRVTFRHVEYDMEKAVAEIRDSEVYALAKGFAEDCIYVMRNGRYEK